MKETEGRDSMTYGGSAKHPGIEFKGYTIRLKGSWDYLEGSTVCGKCARASGRDYYDSYEEAAEHATFGGQHPAACMDWGPMASKHGVGSLGFGRTIRENMEAGTMGDHEICCDHCNRVLIKITAPTNPQEE